MTTDSGGLLLRETDRRLNLLARLAECFLDARNPVFVEHSVQELVSQRVYGLALGYEDLNDHEQLRRDPLLRVLAGKADVEDSPLAGKSTLNRLELSDGTPNRYKKITFWKAGIDELLVKVFLESHATAPEEIILDVDATDFPLHGEQEGRFFHGYYDCYCYLPLYIFCGDQILCARLRQSNSDAAAGTLAEVQRIVGQIRTAWPEVRIVLRGDSGFCRNELMSWCEETRVDYVFGLARNQRLRRIIGPQMWAATEQWNQTGKPARVFTEFSYQTRKRKNGGWSRERRVVAKAEHRRQRESALCGDVADSGAMGAASAVRRTLLRARGDGEPHQGAVQPVCRSRQRRDDEGGSDAAVLFDHGLRAGVRLASTGAEEHGTGAGASVHHSHAVAEDRRAGSCECAAGSPVDGGELPVGRAVRPSSCPVAGDANARRLRGGATSTISSDITCRGQLAELCAEVADGTCFQGVLDFGRGHKPLCTIHVAWVYADFRRHRSEISSQLQPTRPLRPV